MEGHCSTGQSPQWAVVPMEEEEVRQATGDGIIRRMHFARWKTKATNAQNI